VAGIIINNIDYNILVVGPIYNNSDKILKINDLAKQYKVVIINSGLCHPGISDIPNNILNFKSSISKNVIYNLGSDDLKSCKNTSGEAFQWLKLQPNVILLQFKNQTSTIIVNGGVTPQMKKDYLIDNIEVSFVSKIDGQPWHNKYYGGYGYIISNNPLTMEKPKFYPFSVQMGNKYEINYEIYAQEVTPWGLKKTFLL
jgi:hypothetical protein